MEANESSRYSSTITIETLPFSALSDTEVQTLLTKHTIGLTVEEARRVQKLLGRDPTLVEAVIWGVQGSEHCSYKSSKRFLKQFHTEGKHVILGPSEDSGIIAITDSPKGKRWGIVVSHESHNHPSQIVPYEGAATGVGGIVRDVLCMGARVVSLLDPLRLGDLKSNESKTIAKEVVRGIGGYGNALGIPNLGGDTEFDSAYNDNCLVNVVCHGIVREDEVIHSFAPTEAGEIGYDIIIVGKPTDRSGFGGASFASITLEEDEKEKNTGAVQEPNPFLERHLLDSTYALFDWLAAEKKLDKVGFKDLGAGGVVCASVEQVADRGFGADIDLEKVHTAIQGLPPEVIAAAETQERFCWTCHPDLTDYILTHYNKTWDLPAIAENARASVIGKVTSDAIYRLRYKGEIMCEAKAKDITCGLEYERPIKEKKESHNEPSIKHLTSNITNIEEIFLKILSHPNHASKAPIFRHYDKNVLGNSIIEPGEADAGVIAPLVDLASYVHDGTHPEWEIDDTQKWTGVAISCDGNGRYGKISAYWQGANAVAESMRNVAAVGATPRALTDCLNYGNPETPEKLWELSEGVRGIAEAAKGIAIEGSPVPVISGNVSLYNAAPSGSIPPTAIVSCIGVMPDARKAVSMQIQEPDLSLFLLGERKDECGGSAFYEVFNELGANIPRPDFAVAGEHIAFVIDAIQNELVKHCHDISSGGLLLTLFEMLTPQRRQASQWGMDIDLSGLKSDVPAEKLLFSETGGFVMAVATDCYQSLQQCAQKHDVSITHIGQSTSKRMLDIRNVCSFELDTMLKVWEGALANILGL
jgi:phosphoribosylformylglycinamidine synthase subunit PurL